jgi:benzil reductase ((S)-benzoin forming)
MNISSGAALRPIQSWGTYCQSKAAIDMLTKIINEEHPNIKAYSIYPGVVDTEMQKKIRDTDIEKFPLKDIFVEYFNNKELIDPKIISQKIYHILSNLDFFNDNMVSLRDLSIK